MFRFLALLVFVVSTGNAFAHPTFPGVEIHYDRCGGPNPKITLCVARSDAGHVYIVTLNPDRAPGFIPVTEVTQQGLHCTDQVFTGSTAMLLEPNGGIYEHSVELKLRTSEKTPWESEGSLTMDGQPYYPHLEMNEAGCPK